MRSDPPSRAHAVATDLPGFLTTVFTEVCFGAESRHPVATTVARYFHPDYEYRAGADVVPYAEFVGQMRRLRRSVARGRLEVVRSSLDGREVAGRFRVHHVRVDGSHLLGEVFFFGVFASDFRFLRSQEVSWPVPSLDVGADLDGSR